MNIVPAPSSRPSSAASGLACSDSSRLPICDIALSVLDWNGQPSRPMQSSR